MASAVSWDSPTQYCLALTSKANGRKRSSQDSRFPEETQFGECPTYVHLRLIVSGGRRRTEEERGEVTRRGIADDDQDQFLCVPEDPGKREGTNAQVDGYPGAEEEEEERPTGVLQG